MRRLLASLVRTALVIILVAAGTAVGLQYFGKAVFGTHKETSDRQVIRAIKRTEQISLLSLSVQGLKESSQSRVVFGQTIPGSGERVLLKYEFTAKLGVDGADVDITRTGPRTLSIALPAFSFIGYDQPTFEVAAVDGGALSFVTLDIDRVEMVNEILDPTERQTYLSQNEQALEDQAERFYRGIVEAIDPSYEISFTFASKPR